VQIALFDHLLLLAAILAAATLVRLLRRNEGIGRSYTLVVGGGLAASVLAIGGDRFVGVLALALVVVTVIVPGLLEPLIRGAFARGRLVALGRLSTVRAMLMPGAGLDRQLPILAGLALLERKGVDAALAHFRRLAAETEEPGELALIHEQIVAMLFHGQRWDEGIAHYERRFRAGYAALRPSLALGLLRAYGESGQLEHAAGLLRALEDGPVGADPSSAGLLGQARLTFLAYAGAVEPIAELVDRRRFDALGLTAATAELFHGIAQARAGEPKQALETLAKLEQLAGPRDHRVLEAAGEVLAEIRQAFAGERSEVAGTASGNRAAGGRWVEAEIGPELRGYVELVGDRLREFLLAAPALRPSSRPWVTHALVGTLALVYGIHLLRGGGGIGLLELGALSEDLWRGGTAGSWARVFTSAWIHVDLVGLLFDGYALWLAGQLVERTLGPARMACATLLAAFAGVAVSVLSLPLLWDAGLDSLAIVAPTGGNLMAVGGICAALWMLLPRRTPQLPTRSRRNLALTLTLLLVANLLTSWPGLVGFGVAPLAVLTTLVVASLTTFTGAAFDRATSSTGVVAGVPAGAGASRWVGRGLGAIVGIAVAVNLAAFGLVFGEDPEAYLVDHRAQRCAVAGVVVRTPIGVVPMTLDREVPFELPVVDGLLDTLELRDGQLVQLAVYAGTPSPEQPALFAMLEGLDGELSATAPGPLPEPFTERIAADPSWRAFDLWRNGVRVGRVVERQLDGGPEQGAATVMLLASPAEAIEHGAAVYAAILREAEFDSRAGQAVTGRARCQVE
jgi:membrane associated rhomboid family serine protease